jgi:MFS family permease
MSAGPDFDVDPSIPILKHKPFALFWFARVAATIAFHIMAVSIAWQLYDLTNSKFDLGLLGLVQFVPLVPLTLLVGHVADRYDRRLIIGFCELLLAVCAALLLLGNAGAWIDRAAIFSIVFLAGCVRAFEIPTMMALLPTLVPRTIIPRATAWWASANQTAQIAGPAIGGILLTIGPKFAYGTAAALFVVAAVLVILIPPRPVEPRQPITLDSILSGFTFIRQKPVLLGTISLDLFAVLLGSSVALLPVFARDVLNAGPDGFGYLRSAPAMGALVASVVLANRPMRGHIGRNLFGAIMVFGCATALFGISPLLPLSMLALSAVGAADVTSVVIRSSLVQLNTPDALRGRVAAANSMFIGTSNQLGDFRAGTVAQLIGAVPAVVLGGLTTVAIAVAWMVWFPELRRMRRLDDE